MQRLASSHTQQDAISYIAHMSLFKISLPTKNQDQCSSHYCSPCLVLPSSMCNLYRQTWYYIFKGIYSGIYSKQYVNLVLIMTRKSHLWLGVMLILASQASWAISSKDMLDGQQHLCICKMPFNVVRCRGWGDQTVEYRSLYNRMKTCIPWHKDCCFSCMPIDELYTLSDVRSSKSLETTDKD